jgi:hypothetical protein
MIDASALLHAKQGPLRVTLQGREDPALGEALKRVFDLAPASDAGLEHTLSIVRGVLRLADPAGASSSGAVDEETDACPICYANVDGGPTARCSNCAQSFHHQCLSAWLRPHPQTRTVFGALVGPCPTCQHHLTCKSA